VRLDFYIKAKFKSTIVLEFEKIRCALTTWERIWAWKYFTSLLLTLDLFFTHFSTSTLRKWATKESWFVQNDYSAIDVLKGFPGLGYISTTRSSKQHTGVEPTSRILISKMRCVIITWEERRRSRKHLFSISVLVSSVYPPALSSKIRNQYTNDSSKPPSKILMSLKASWFGLCL
jgi:hypothetical protein